MSGIEISIHCIVLEGLERFDPNALTNMEYFSHIAIAIKVTVVTHF